jgi:hypothetical protein
MESTLYLASLVIAGYYVYLIDSLHRQDKPEQ